MSQTTDTQVEPAVDETTDEAPKTVPGKGKAKTAKPKADKPAKDPKHPFGQPKVGSPKANAKAPSDEKLKALGKIGLRKTVTELTGLAYGATLWLTPRELKLMIKGELPFNSKGLGVNDVTVRKVEDAYDLAVQRKTEWNKVEAERIKEREQARRDTFGDQFEGVERGSDEFIRRMIGDKVLVPVQPAEVRHLPRGDRFYDVDGRAGRTSYYEFVAQDDLKSDGKPKAKARIVRISPHVVERILADEELAKSLDVPDGFGKPAPKEPKEPKAKKPAAKSKRRSVKDSLAEAEPEELSTNDQPVEPTPADEPEAPQGDELDIPEL